MNPEIKMYIDPAAQQTEVDPSPFSYETVFQKSVEDMVNYNVNQLTNLEKYVHEFNAKEWPIVKSKNILLLKTSMPAIEKKFSQIVEAALVLGDNHVFNMVIRISDLASTVRGFDVLKAGDHRRLALRLFKHINDSVLYGEDPVDHFKETINAIALKPNGFEEKLQSYKEFFQYLTTLLHHFATDLGFLIGSKKNAQILETMVEYFHKVEDEADAAVVA